MLLELLVLTLELVVCVQLLVELVLSQLDLVTVSLNHDLLNLVLLDMLIDSILFAWGKRGQFVKPISPRLHIVTVERNSKRLTDLRVIYFEHALILLFFELLL